MAVVSGPLPYDLAHLLGGAARVIVSDPSAPPSALPENINDFIDCETPYATKTGYLDLGATTEGTSYSRDMDSEGYEIEQTSGTIFEEITEVSRRLDVNMGEINPQNLQILEEAPSVATVAAVVGEAVAQKAVAFGSIQSLTSRQVIFVGMRNKQSGVVSETTGSITRGRFVALVLYNATIAADSSEVEVAKGSLASLPVSFVAFPAGGETQGQEFGTWLLEDAGTIS